MTDKPTIEEAERIDREEVYPYSDEDEGDDADS